MTISDYAKQLGQRILRNPTMDTLDSVCNEINRQNLSEAQLGALLQALRPIIGKLSFGSLNEFAHSADTVESFMDIIERKTKPAK